MEGEEMEEDDARSHFRPSPARIRDIGTVSRSDPPTTHGIPVPTDQQKGSAELGGVVDASADVSAAAAGTAPYRTRTSGRPGGSSGCDVGDLTLSFSFTGSTLDSTLVVASGEPLLASRVVDDEEDHGPTPLPDGSRSPAWALYGIRPPKLEGDVRAAPPEGGRPPLPALPVSPPVPGVGGNYTGVGATTRLIPSPRSSSTTPRTSTPTTSNASTPEPTPRGTPRTRRVWTIEELQGGSVPVVSASTPLRSSAAEKSSDAVGAAVVDEGHPSDEAEVDAVVGVRSSSSSSLGLLQVILFLGLVFAVAVLGLLLLRTHHRLVELEAVLNQEFSGDREQDRPLSVRRTLDGRTGGVKADSPRHRQHTAFPPLDHDMTPPSGICCLSGERTADLDPWHAANCRIRWDECSHDCTRRRSPSRAVVAGTAHNNAGVLRREVSSCFGTGTELGYPVSDWFPTPVISDQ